MDRPSSDRPARERLVVRLSSAACAVAAACWLVVAHGGATPLRQAAGVALLAGVPAALVALAWLGRRGVVRAGRRRWTVRLAKLALVLAWLPAGAFAAVWVVLAERWPLSRSQGPDTERARATFEAELGFAPPASVRDLYAQRAWAGPGEHAVCVRFRFDDDDALEAIIGGHGLEPVDDARALTTFPGPSWWPATDELQRADEAYRLPRGDAQRFVHLPRGARHPVAPRVDRAARIAYLQDVDAN